MRPRIVIPLPTSTDRRYNEQNWPAYAACLEASGAEPVPAPLDLPVRDLLVLASSCQGICLPGSPADVDPPHYGHERNPASAPPDFARERTDKLLLESVFGAQKPLLAICFGLQSLNVFRGGSLVQDLGPMPVNHAAGAAVGVAHFVSVAPESFLARVAALDGTAEEGLGRIPVNSSHHQAVGVPGEGLRVTGRCPEDGVVEALELASDLAQWFLLGVQWHPERTFDTPISLRLFTGFVDAARTWRRI